MPFDSRFNLNNHNFYFENNNILGLNHVGMGYNCGTVLTAKLSVQQTHPTSINSNSTAILGENNDVSNIVLMTYTGVNGTSTGVQNPNFRILNQGGDFLARGGSRNFGVSGTADDNTGSPQLTVGVNGAAYGSPASVGVRGLGNGGAAFSKGGDFTGIGSPNDNYGVYGLAIGGNVATGVWAESAGAPFGFASWTNGTAASSQQGIFLSDQQFKTDVSDMESALETINKLQPKNYYMDTVNYPHMQFATKMQYGFIAQEVELVLPDVIHDNLYPAKYDEDNNIIAPEMPIKLMNYNAIIPINTLAIKELDREIQNQTLSDQTIKTNVVDLNNSLNKVLAMRGISYDWTTSAQTNYDLDAANHIGFIAQEIQQVDSRLTFIGRDSLLHVEYEKVVPILVEAIEELNDEVEAKDSIINDMNARLTTLENCLSSILPFLCQLNQSAVQANTPASQEAIRAQLSVKLTNKETIVLDQNVPNPFAEQTVINFSIPETVQKAQIHFYNSEGRIIQSVDVVERGLGSITVFGSDLSTGIYTYTLVADGISVATKKMMKN